MDSDAATNQPLRDRSTAGPWRGYPSATAQWRGPAAVATALLCAALLAACGSSHSSATSASAQIKQTCQQVEAVLSDGPEPEADPVGYAQAQVLPLRQIHTSDVKLHEAIDRLASSYETFSTGNAASSAKTAVSAASKAIERICPGVAS